MAEYDPQRSRPRRRVTDDAGPAPVDEMLDAAPEQTHSSPEPSRPATAVSPASVRRASSVEGGDVASGPPEVIDLNPRPPTAPSAGTARRARILLVLVVLVLALVGFVLRRIGASRRARRL